MNPIIPTIQSVNPPSKTTIIDAQKRDILRELNCVKIGVIVSYDPGEVGIRPPTASVQIAQEQVTSVDTDGNKTFASYSPLELVPVYFPGGGGFSLTFPVNVGDECLLLFNDRQLDNWYLNGAGNPPTLNNLHDLSDAIALVGMRSCPRALGSVSTISTQLRSDDDSTYVEVKTGQIVNIKAPGGINLNGVLIDSVGNVIIPQTLVVENLLGASTPSRVSGEFMVTGGDIVADSISLKTHVHGDVSSGPDETGVPV
jgi:phage baseplate assembly protein gpV